MSTSGRALTLAIVGVVIGAAVSCSRATAHEIDGGSETGASICDPQGPRIGPCTAEVEALCQSWAESLAPTGTTARSRCYPRGGGYCVRGDSCEPYDGLHDPYCGCSSPADDCGPNGVCISDTPGGTPRCVPACS